ncbi:dTDP-4-dehydrorhamnose 3,5-epimerase [Maricaulis sp.]|uniref:dTDP-4-dehydrorhamnose 3,5-epimerase n=1 Tax=Maricaulis sp. TaxID=1486257 RepID=UPI002636F341|nr:dTDP-4-dehydrorhamnose 3,5-epimerase [Maricaulis sp.]
MTKRSLHLDPLALPGAFRILAPRFSDARGYFEVAYNRRDLAAAGLSTDFIQDNQSLSRETGTVRGLHYQLPPFQQAKLVRVLTGRILDVMVDARTGSPTYGQHCAIELDAEDGTQVFVPRGFLHGFVTREPDTVVLYKVDNDYAPGHDRSLVWNDPDLNIDWGISAGEAVLSDKDRAAGSWADFASPFSYQD